MPAIKQKKKPNNPLCFCCYCCDSDSTKKIKNRKKKTFRLLATPAIIFLNVILLTEEELDRKVL